MLDSVPMHDGCPYVFANPNTLKPYVSFFSAWNTVRKSVGLGDVRVHDLRHSFASFLVNSGRSLYGSVALLIKSRNFPGKELRPSNWTDFPR